MRRSVSALTLALSCFIAPVTSAQAEKQTAIFAGGCFWCIEADFDKVKGVVSTTSGYIGGAKPNPTYKKVSAGGTGYKEAVKIVFDSNRVSYDDLLKKYWRSIDPFDAAGQFCDKGDSYKAVIYILGDDQRAAAEASKKDAEKVLGQKTVVPIVSASKFWPAEDYHQDYHTKNPLRYTYYRSRCGRDDRVKAVWGR